VIHVPGFSFARPTAIGPTSNATELTGQAAAPTAIVSTSNAIRGPGISGHFAAENAPAAAKKIAGGAACRDEVKDHVFHKQYVIF
jgi:hypothetical protein